MSNVKLLPIWKKNATVEERLQELAHMAREHPERFVRFVIVYEEELEGRTKTRVCHSDNVDTTSVIGLLECGKLDSYLGAVGL